MEVIGRIIMALPEVSGTSKAGNPWKKREYVLETLDSYSRKIFFDFFGERADQFPLAVGQEIKLSFDIESREYQGRWYTSIRGWKAEPATAAQQPQPDPMAQPAAFNNPPVYNQAPQQPFNNGIPTPPAQEGYSDDIPF